ncbi:uncharacterized protein isoform X1 [Rhodnius prolixus]|uniref:uncharacterized protein isoform X1 n=1 Tax=Rhodnius prolixus TaxID=13249 RepID=UPI003D18C4F3
MRDRERRDWNRAFWLLKSTPTKLFWNKVDASQSRCRLMKAHHTSSRQKNSDCRYDGGQLLIGDIWRCDQRRAMLSEVTLLFWRSVGQLLQSLSPPPWSSS